MRKKLLYNLVLVLAVPKKDLRHLYSNFISVRLDLYLERRILDLYVQSEQQAWDEKALWLQQQVLSTYPYLQYPGEVYCIIHWSKGENFF